MCDINIVNQRNITFEEPNALFWTKPGCVGGQMALPPGDYPNMYNLAIKQNDIDGIWLPPNMKLHAFGNPDFVYSYGVYDPGLYADLNNPLLYAPRNTIDSFRLSRIRPWKDHLTNCCTGKTTEGASPLTCGMFWGKGDMANRGVCDDFMEKYCKDPANAADEKCTCYAVPIDPADDINVQLLKANPKCWSQKCQTSGYMPSNIVNMACPNVKICKQDIALPGSNNIITGAEYIQDCSDKYTITNNTTINTPTPTTPNTPTTPTTPNTPTTQTPPNTQTNTTQTHTTQTHTTQTPATTSTPIPSTGRKYLIIFLAFIIFICLVISGYFTYRIFMEDDDVDEQSTKN